MNEYFENLATALKQGAYLAVCEMELCAYNENEGINDEDALNDLNNMLKDIEKTIATIRNEFNISNQ